jgi:hypothetical protein
MYLQFNITGKNARKQKQAHAKPKNLNATKMNAGITDNLAIAWLVDSLGQIVASENKPQKTLVMIPTKKISGGEGQTEKQNEWIGRSSSM